MRNLRNDKHRSICTFFALIMAMMLVLSSVAPIFASGDAPDPAAGAKAADVLTDETASANPEDGRNSDQGGSDTDISSDKSSDAENDEPHSDETAKEPVPEETENPAPAEETVTEAPMMKAQGVSAQEDEFIKPSYGTSRDFGLQIEAVDVQRMGSTQTSWSEVTDDNPVKTGDDVKFTLTFTLPTKYLTHDDAGNPSRTNTITYKITPPIGEIKAESGLVVSEGGKVLGTYTITPKPGENPTGEVTIIFTEEAVTSNATSRLNKGTVTFTSSVDGWEGKDDGVVEVPIGGSVGNVEIIVQPQDATGDIKIKKGTSSFDKTTGDITYTMDISSASGTKTNVTVSDTMVSEVIKGQGNFKVVKKTPAVTDPETGDEITPASETTVTPISLKNEKGETTFNDSDGNHDSGFEIELPPLGANEVYTITYEAHYPKLVNGSVSVRNTAIAKSTDKDDKLLISTSSTSNTLSSKPLEKTGKLIEITTTDSSGKEIGTGQYYVEWTVLINQSKVDIGGWSLSDTGLYNDGNNLTAKDIKLVGTKEDGTTFDITIGDMTLDGTQTLYTFPSGDKSSYVLTYKTSMDFDDDKYEAKNTIKMEPPVGDKDNENNEPSSTTPGIGGVETEKDHEDIEVDLSSDPATAYITWKMKLDAKAAPIPAGSTFADTLGDKQEFADVDALKQAVEQAFSAQGISITWKNKIRQADGTEKDIDSAKQFAFSIDTKIDKGKVIEFDYKVKILDFNPKEQKEYSNSAILTNPNNETIGTPTDKVTYKPAISKYDSSSGKRTADSTYYVGAANVTYKDNKQTIKWGFDVNLPASYYDDSSNVEYVIISDELPEGVKPVYLGFRPNGSNAYAEFSGIASATESSPAEWSQKLPDVLATQDDVDNGLAGSVGEIISEGATYRIQAWFDKSEGANGAVKLKIPKDTIKYFKDKTYEFNIFAQIPDDFNWGKNERGIKEHSFENNAYLLVSDGDKPTQVLDAKHTQTILNDDNARSIIKGNEYDAASDNRTIPYRIVVNEEGKDLLEGGDILDFKDVLTATYPYGVSVTLVPESFKVYEVDRSSLTYTKNAANHEVVDSSKVRRTKDITDSVGFNHVAGKKSGDNWVITAKLPDKKTLLVQYDYHITGYTTGRERVTLKNTSEITGVATDSNNDDWSDAIAVQKSDSSIDIMRVTLEKVDRANGNKALEGAVFKLYTYDGSKYIEIGNLVTNEKGQLIIDDGHIQSTGKTELEFNYNTAYRLVEIRPPKGYKLDYKPIDFYVMDRDRPVTDYSNEQYIPDDFGGYLLGADSFLYFDNVQSHPNFKVEKIAAEDKVELGGIIEYTIKATNTGKDDAYDCTIVDILGKGLEYVDDDGDGTNNGKITTWTKDIMAGQTVTIKFYARAVKSVKGGFVNSAYVEYNDVEGDVNSEKVLAEVELDDGSDGKGADTGDYTNMYIYVTLMAIAVTAIAYVYMRRRRDN